MPQFLQDNRELENVQVERRAIAQDSTANAGAFTWINPTGRGVFAQVTYRFSTAGTGTIDIGVSTAGTGSNDNIIDGGTLTGVITSLRTTPGTAGATSWFFIAASGGGNSIVAKHSDTETSTAVGTAYIQYYVV